MHNCIELGTRSHTFMSLEGLSSHTTAFAAARVSLSGQEIWIKQAAQAEISLAQ